MNTLQREWKALQRKQTRFKYKIIFTLILPVFLVVLGAKVLRTFLEIRLRQLSEPSVQPPARKDIPEELPKKPEPISKEPVETIFIQPEPVSSITITEEE